MVDVFISYSRDNRGIVEQLAAAVARQGYSVWWDEDVPPHLSYSDVIAQTIRDAKAAIVVWSGRAGASQWVRAEADLAREQSKLIQASVDNSMPPMPFNQIQFASIGDWRGEEDHPGWRKIKTSLKALCGPGVEATAPAAPPPAPAPPVPAPSPPAPPAPVPEPPAPPAHVPEPPRPAPRAAYSDSPPAGSPGGRRWLIALIVVSVAVLIGVGILALVRGREPAPAEEAEKATSAPPRPAGRAVAGQFTQEAVINEAADFAEVRGDPSASALVVTRIGNGEIFATYAQTGPWWRVRTAQGAIGYLPRTEIRMIVSAPAAPPVEARPLPAVPAPTPVPAPVEPPRAASLDGNWGLVWRAGGVNYSGTLIVRDRAALLLIAVQAPGGLQRVQQTCSVARSGRSVTLRCGNVRLISGPPGYTADNFGLVLVGDSVMRGRNFGGPVSGPATFTRR